MGTVAMRTRGHGESQYAHGIDGRTNLRSTVLGFLNEVGLDYVGGDLGQLRADVLRFDSFLVAQLRTRHLNVRWTRNDVQARNWYLMIVVTKGEITAECGGRRYDVDGRRILIEPGSDPVDLIALEHSEALLFTFDGKELGTRAPDPAVLRAAVWASPLTRALFSCLRALLDQTARSYGDESAVLRDLVREIARCVVAIGSSIVPADVFDRAQEVIRREFGDPALSVERVAERLRLSRSTLDRAFASRGLSIAREIRRARADFAIAGIEGQPASRLSELSARAGFGSVDSLRRALREFHEERWDHAMAGQGELVS